MVVVSAVLKPNPNQNCQTYRLAHVEGWNPFLEEDHTFLELVGRQGKNVSSQLRCVKFDQMKPLTCIPVPCNPSSNLVF